MCCTSLNMIEKQSNYVPEYPGPAMLTEIIVASSNSILSKRFATYHFSVPWLLSF